MTRRRRGPGGPSPGPKVNAETLIRTSAMVNALVDRWGGLYPGTKSEFAEEMHWVDDDGVPQRRWVEDACNLTRDPELLTRYSIAARSGFLYDKAVEDLENLAGYGVTYAEVIGCLTLVDENGDMSPGAMIHWVGGEALRDQTQKTINRRRVEVWRKVARQRASVGDTAFALDAYAAADQLERTGHVSDDTTAKILTHVGRYREEES